MDASGKMYRLSDSAVRLLGSTQVITSVFSVVKELVENSLDAGATSVEIKLENYGLDKVEVRDNGSGIGKDDVPVFAKRHYTSKITSQSDLETLTTYGFRGEALASLCAVSEVSVTTKTSSDDVSLTHTLSEEGEIMNTTPSHLGQGTTVCAKNLFKNLPVRKQFHNATKKKKEDLKNVENLLLAYSVVLPKVRFSLRHNKEMVWQKVTLENSSAVLQSILGKGTVGKMEWKRKEFEDLQVKMELCLPKPGSDVSSLSRSTSDRSFLCINSRPVTIKEIDKLIRQYYSNCHACDVSRRPMYYVNISLPTKDVDVNIDPNKTTVMTTNMNLLCERLEEMLLQFYGPLDNTPSWRYRYANDKQDKSLETFADKAAHSVLERLSRASSMENTPATSLAKGADSSESVNSEIQAPSDKENTGREIPQMLPSTSSSLGCSKPHSTNEDQAPRQQVQPTLIFHENTNATAADELSLKPGGVPETESRSKVLEDSRGGDFSLQSDSSDVKSKELNLRREKGHEPLSTSLENQTMSSNIESKSSEQNARNNASNTVPVTASGCESTNTNTAKALVSINKGMTSRLEDAGSSTSLCEVEGSKSTKTAETESAKSADRAAWNLGTSVRSEEGVAVQPVQLLAPSSGQFPGKRPLSPSHDQQAQKTSVPPEKRGRRLCPAQSTLYDMINNTAVKRPMSAKEFFFKDKRTLVVEQNPQADYDRVTDILEERWEKLPDELRVAFREKCWNDTNRYNKEVADAKKGPESNNNNKQREQFAKKTTSSKAKRLSSVRDMVAASSTQPSEKPPAPKRKAPHFASVTDLQFDMKFLRNSLTADITPSQTQLTSGIQVLGHIPSCGVWVCSKGPELCMLNVHRLSEVIVYHRMLNQHRLPVHHCQPVRLTRSNTGGYWWVLEKLVESQVPTGSTFIHITDPRIVANGFEVKCWKDGDGQLCAELVGLCGDVPTYCYKDLVEVLELLSKDITSSLAQSRPIKVVSYLKGEAVRMVRGQASERSKEDVQDMLEDAASFLPVSCNSCLHSRPFFHTLLADVDSAAASQDSMMSSLEESAVGVPQGETSSSSEHLKEDSYEQLVSLDDFMDFD